MRDEIGVATFYSFIITSVLWVIILVVVIDNMNYAWHTWLNDKGVSEFIVDQEDGSITWQWTASDDVEEQDSKSNTSTPLTE